MSEFAKHHETREHRGQNITIHNYFVRHSQKASGAVFNAEKTGLSVSSLSAGGVERAKERGKTIAAQTHGAKGYRSDSPRTLETFQGLMEGYTANNPETTVREKVRIREQLLAPKGTKEWIAEYDQKWTANKNRLLAEGIQTGKYPNVEFSKLTPNQQEEIAEAAEEPVIREWIDNPNSDMAKKFPPRIQAANFAVLFDQRGQRMAERLNENSAVDLFHNTHKTATEPFLASGVLIRKSDNKRITSLEDIGGSLQILDQWESVTKTDEQGNPTTTVLLRGEEYQIDPLVLKQLIQEGSKAQKRNRDAKLSEKHHE